MIDRPILHLLIAFSLISRTLGCDTHTSAPAQSPPERNAINTADGSIKGDPPEAVTVHGQPAAPQRAPVQALPERLVLMPQTVNEHVRVFKFSSSSGNKDLSVTTTHFIWRTYRGIVRLPREGGELVTLNSEDDEIRDLDADEDAVYFTQDARVYRLDPNTGHKRVLATQGEANAKGGRYLPGRMAQDKEHLYWTSDGPVGGNVPFGIWRVAKTGGPIQGIQFQRAKPPMELLVVEDVLIFARYYGGGIMRVPKAGGKRVTLTHDQLGVTMLAATPKLLYWSLDDGAALTRGLHHYVQDGVVLLKDEKIRALAVDESHVYWVTASGTLKRLPHHLSSESSIEILAKDLSPPVYASESLVITEGQAFLLGIDALSVVHLPKARGSSP